MHPIFVDMFRAEVRAFLSCGEDDISDLDTESPKVPGKR
jgi:hypothetical protein